jgi:hypothetical protein
LFFILLLINNLILNNKPLNIFIKDLFFYKKLKNFKV